MLTSPSLETELRTARMYFRHLGYIPAGCAARLEWLAVNVAALEDRWASQDG